MTPAQRNHARTAVIALQVFAVGLFVVPANAVFTPVGANGYVASMVALSCFMLWLAATVFGQHNPLRRRHPVQWIIAGLWGSTLVSYLLRVSPGTEAVRAAAADRWLVLLVAITGVAFVAAEGLRSEADLRRVVGAVVWGATFSAFVALLQFTLRMDITPWLSAIPGFHNNVETAVFSPRYSLLRVAGTGMGPIDFGVAMGMVAPLAIWRAMAMPTAPALRRWVPVLMCLLGGVMSVSRSGLLAITVSMVVLVFMLPAKERLFTLAAAPVFLVAVFALIPGFVATMTSYVTGAGSDPSVTTRTDDYGFAMQFVQDSPWIGHGPGWYVFADALAILDNQYLGTAIDLGLLGVLALLGFLVGPALVALRARKMSTDPSLRLLAAALAAASLSGAINSAAFDSLSFPFFVCLQALVCGLSGAVWLLARAEAASPEHREASLVAA